MKTPLTLADDQPMALPTYSFLNECFNICLFKFAPFLYTKEYGVFQIRHPCVWASVGILFPFAIVGLPFTSLLMDQSLPRRKAHDHVSKNEEQQQLLQLEIDRISGLSKKQSNDTLSEATSALRIAREIGQPSQIFDVLILRAAAFRTSAEYDQCKADLFEAFAIAKEQHSSERTLQILSLLGVLYRALGAYDAARLVLDFVIERRGVDFDQMPRLVALLTAALGKTDSITKGKILPSGAASDDARLAEAMALLGEALMVATDIHDEISLYLCTQLMGYVASARGHFDVAVEHYERAAKYYEEAARPVNFASINLDLAAALIGREDYDYANVCVERASSVMATNNLATFQMVKRALIESALERLNGDLDTAEHIIQSTIARQNIPYVPGQLIEVYDELVRVLERKGDMEQSKHARAIRGYLVRAAREREQLHRTEAELLLREALA